MFLLLVIILSMIMMMTNSYIIKSSSLSSLKLIPSASIVLSRNNLRMNMKENDNDINNINIYKNNNDDNNNIESYMNESSSLLLLLSTSSSSSPFLLISTTILTLTILLTTFPTITMAIDNVFDPSQFQPVCPSSDTFYQVLKYVANSLVGQENVVEYGPLIASVLLRIRLELCVLESFVYEAVIPFIQQKGLSWVLPIHETVETFLAGTIFALASNFILLGNYHYYNLLLINDNNNNYY